MKALLLILVAALFSLQSFTSAQDNQEAMDPSMLAWMEYMTPGAVHEMLAKADGEWNAKITWWMSPGAEPEVSEGKSVNKMILGGRYQLSSHTTPVMGMEMEGMNLVGYDNATNEFTSVWIDNMGTGFSICRGPYDEATGVVKMKGKMVDPVTKDWMPFRIDFTMKDDNTQKMEMYMTHEGQEFKSMEIVYTR